MGLSQVAHNALLDTGATRNHIDNKIAQGFNLRANHTDVVRGFDGERITPVYPAVVYFPDLDLYYTSQFCGAELNDRNHQLAMILGREFLKRCRLDYNGVTGRCWISWI